MSLETNYEITSAKTTEQTLSISRLYAFANEKTIVNTYTCLYMSLTLQSLRRLRQMFPTIGACSGCVQIFHIRTFYISSRSAARYAQWRPRSTN